MNVSLIVFGKFHPLLVHLPIGMLALGFAMELASRTKWFAHLKTAIPFVLLMTALSAVATSFTGWIMPKAGAFDESLLGLHFWFGISLTVACFVLYGLSVSKNALAKKTYFPLFVVNMILLTITGHYGGNLTHGSNYLFEDDTKAIAIEGKVENIKVFDQVIAGIFKKKCISCHNEGKLKGQLLMSTKEGLTEGGENGPMFVANDAKASLFIERIELAKVDDLHMPPNGKAQITNDELKLLKWWVNTGASFDKQVKELEPTEDVLEILEKYKSVKTKSPIALLKSVELSTINSIRAQGILVNPLDAENKIFEATLAYDTLITKRKLKALSKIDKHLLKLNLSFSNVSDQLLSRVADFKNLEKLDLQQTNITANGLDALEDLQRLQSLNLYNTPVDDAALPALKAIPTLKRLYLWKSKISPKAIAQLQNDKPNLRIEHQIDMDIFGSAQLKAPRFDVADDLFKDSLEITIVKPFQGVQIHYTLDGSMPDSTSAVYTKPFTVNNTALVKAIARKAGWETSDATQKVFLQSKLAIKNIQLSSPPNEKYAADGAKSLVDFKKGSDRFSEGNWLGYQGKDVTATLDLGAVLAINNVSVGALEDTGSYIFFPKGVVVEVSTNGKDFERVAEKGIPTSTGPTPSSLQTYLLNFEKKEARYVRVTMQSNLKNPDWHPAPGAPCWMFIDEIVVN